MVRKKTIEDVIDFDPEARKVLEDRWEKNNKAVLALAKQFEAMAQDHGSNPTKMNVVRALAAAFPDHGKDIASTVKFAFRDGEPEIIAQMKKDRRK